MLGDCCGLSFLKKIHRMGGTEPAALFDPPCFVDFATKTFRLHALKNRYGTTTYMTWRTTNLAIVARSRPLANARRCVVCRCLTRRTRCTPRRLPRLRRSRRRLCPWNPPPPPPPTTSTSAATAWFDKLAWAVAEGRTPVGGGGHGGVLPAPSPERDTLRSGVSIDGTNQFTPEICHAKRRTGGEQHARASLPRLREFGWQVLGIR